MRPRLNLHLYPRCINECCLFCRNGSKEVHLLSVKRKEDPVRRPQQHSMISQSARQEHIIPSDAPPDSFEAIVHRPLRTFLSEVDQLRRPGMGNLEHFLDWLGQSVPCGNSWYLDFCFFRTCRLCSKNFEKLFTIVVNAVNSRVVIGLL